MPFVNGLPKGDGEGETVMHPVGRVLKLPGEKKETGPVGFLGFFKTLQESEVNLWRNETLKDEAGQEVKVYYQVARPGSSVLRPGEHPKFAGIRGDDPKGKLNFL